MTLSAPTPAPLADEALPALPPGWELVRVKDVGDVQLGRQRAPQHHTGPHMRPYLRVANVFEDRIDTSDVLEMNFSPQEYETYKLQYGDILLNEGQSLELVGRPAMYRDEVPGACFQNTLVRFRAFDGVVLSKYALHVFLSYLHSGRFQKIAKWTTNIAHLGAQRFAELEFPLPPLAEQRRIVAAIETELTRLDAGVASLRAAQAKLRRYRASVLKAACEGRLVAQDPSDEPASALLQRVLAERRERWAADLRARGKDPAKARYEEPAAPDAAGLPELPAGWVWSSLQSLCSTLTDGDHLPPPQVETGVPFIVIGNVSKGFLDLTDTRFVSTKYYESLDVSRKPKRGDILYTVTGSYGIPILVERDQAFCVQRHIAILRPLDLVNRRYLWATLSSSLVYAQATNRATGTAQKTVSLGVLRGFAIPLPPLAEQRRIVAEVERRLSVVAALEAAMAANLRRAERLRQAILKRAFEGRLVPQDPSDEPASALLERIRAARRPGAASGGRQRGAPSAPQEAPGDTPKRRGRPPNRLAQSSGRPLPPSEPVHESEQLRLEGVE